MLGQIFFVTTIPVLGLVWLGLAGFGLVWLGFGSLKTSFSQAFFMHFFARFPLK